MIEKLDDAVEFISELGNLDRARDSDDSSPHASEKDVLWARIISIVLHPLLMGVYSVCLLFVYTDFSFLFGGQFIRFLTPVFLLSCVIPASCIYLMTRLGLIRGYEQMNKNERFIPYLATALSYCLLIYFFYSAGMYTWFLSMLAAPLILLIVAAVVSMFWKISLHMMGIGGLIGCTLSVSYHVKGINPFAIFIILFILAGCLGVARLILKRHTPAQVYTGFLVGLVVSYLCVLIGAYWGIILLLKSI